MSEKTMKPFDFYDAQKDVYNAWQDALANLQLPRHDHADARRSRKLAQDWEMLYRILENCTSTNETFERVWGDEMYALSIIQERTIKKLVRELGYELPKEEE